MLRTNLATRPFYNERAVHTMLGVVALIVLLLTVYNVGRLVALSRRDVVAVKQAQQAETEARNLSRRAREQRRGLDQRQLEVVAKAAREANQILDRRTFSWTELFNRLEETLPADVRLVAVEPAIGENGVTVFLTVVGRTVADVDAFMENLERSGFFADVAPGDEQVTETDDHMVTVRGRYLVEPRATPAREGA